jgi:hypothetical protein
MVSRWRRDSVAIYIMYVFIRGAQHVEPFTRRA